MFKQLRPALASLLVLSLATGVAYPLLVTDIAQLAFPEQASLLRGAEGGCLTAADRAEVRRRGVVPFARPSAGDYATVSSAASNLAPSNPALAERIARDAAQERIADQGPVPLALVTTSGSGLDPQLHAQARALPGAAGGHGARAAAAPGGRPVGKPHRAAVGGAGGGQRAGAEHGAAGLKR
ncbi:potassium-transporting ATPase subunit C [Pseudomonas aeruginosa]|uniref:potassium-transporting ATPase subunit C n=1 Tax=Pseudomonas aeruginosa TaxID=287 RepID=UPI003D9C0BA2